MSMKIIDQIKTPEGLKEVLEIADPSKLLSLLVKELPQYSDVCETVALRQVQDFLSPYYSSEEMPRYPLLQFIQKCESKNWYSFWAQTVKMLKKSMAPADKKKHMLQTLVIGCFHHPARDQQYLKSFKNFMKLLDSEHFEEFYGAHFDKSSIVNQFHLFVGQENTQRMILALPLLKELFSAAQVEPVVKNYVRSHQLKTQTEIMQNFADLYGVKCVTARSQCEENLRKDLEAVKQSNFSNYGFNRGVMHQLKVLDFTIEDSATKALLGNYLRENNYLLSDVLIYNSSVRLRAKNLLKILALDQSITNDLHTSAIDILKDNKTLHSEVKDNLIKEMQLRQSVIEKKALSLQVESGSTHNKKFKI